MRTLDLRIGNLLHHIGFGTGEVRAIRTDLIALSNPENKNQWVYEPEDTIYRIEPIPLTEEWLLKLGFKEIKNFYDDVEKVYQKDCYYITKNIGVWRFGLGFEDYCMEIKYIHKLQNLYHALTGEELCV